MDDEQNPYESPASPGGYESDEESLCEELDRYFGAFCCVVLGCSSLLFPVVIAMAVRTKPVDWLWFSAIASACVIEALITIGAYASYDSWTR